MVLPDNLSWAFLIISDKTDCEPIHKLLSENYVSDARNYFRYYYSVEFIYWVLTSPSSQTSFILAVHEQKSNQLIAFLSASRASLRVSGSLYQALEATFLCVAKAYRGYRLTPILIQETIRKAHLEGLLTAIYTSGTSIHQPVALTKYFQRFINPQKLEKLGFTCFDRTLGPQYIMKKYAVEETTQIPLLRPMQVSDTLQVKDLLLNYLRNFEIYQEFTIEEILHNFLPRNNVVYSWVAEENGEILDFFSFYMLGIQSVRRPNDENIKVANCFYYASTRNSVEILFRDMLVCAQRSGADMMNALNIMENQKVFESLQFEETDGFLNYYLYNWNSKLLSPNLIGKVLI